MYKPTTKQAGRKRLIVKQRSFPKGVVTVLQSSRIPNTGLSDMTNMDMIQDSIVRPRQSTVAYGPAALGTIIGIGTFTKLSNGAPERWQITMQNIAGVSQIVINKDGGAWTTIGGSYNATAWCQFTQSNNRVYVSNGVDTMSYYDITAGTITTYTAVAAPAAPTLARNTLTAGSITIYYGITANNNVGETAVVISSSLTVNKDRTTWIPTTESITVSGTAVANATSYNFYYSLTPFIGDFNYLTTLSPGTGNNPIFTDNGSTVINIFKAAPAADSTGGPKLSYLISKNGQLFGVGDLTAGNQYNLWYSGKGTHSGDFSPFNGGGNAFINYGGDSYPTVVRSFRDGKGNPVVTVLTKGSAGNGKFYHAAETTTSYGGMIIPYFQVTEANGQSGTISPFGVVEANNNIYYPTGSNFKSTGTQPNIVNILATNSVSQAIDPSVRGLNLKAMSKCVGLLYNERIYWALPNGTNSNNEIWILDLSRGGLWILRWTIAADWLFLYEDNSGVTHFSALVNNVIVEFTSSVATQDQGVPFRTRVASGDIVWDDSGISMAAVQSQYFKFLSPRGQIQVNNYGLGEDITGQQTLGGTTYNVTANNTGYGQWDYSGIYKYGDDVGFIDSYSASIGMVILEPDETLNSINWEVITTGSGCDYSLSTVSTVATIIPSARLGD